MVVVIVGTIWGSFLARVLVLLVVLLVVECSIVVVVCSRGVVELVCRMLVSMVTVSTKDQRQWCWGPPNSFQLATTVASQAISSEIVSNIETI